MTRFLLAAVLVAAAVLVLPLGTALAQSDPDNLEIQREMVARDLLEDGDMLVVIKYNIAYTTTPDDDAGELFLAHLRDDSDSIIASDTPYPFEDDGYGPGVMSVYLSASETNAEGLTDGTGSWSAWPFADWDVTLRGNPSQFSPVPNVTVALTSGDFTDGSGSDTNQDQLATEITTIASQLQSSWQVDLVNESGRLNATGSEYFVVAIPESRRMAPGAFAIISTSPTFPDAPTAPGAGSLAQRSESRFSSTFWITPALERASQDLDLPDKAVPGFVSFAIMMAVMILLVLAAQRRQISPQKALTAGFIINLVAVLPSTMFVGWVPWQWGAVVIGFVSAAGIIRLAFNWMR